MAHTVAVGEFEGPLALLLELVESGKMEVSSIAVGELTAKYLSRLDALQTRDPEELSEFLGLGARLVYIKSLALLPQESAGEQAEELRQLSLELTEYRRMQTAARELSRRARWRTWPRPVTERLGPHELPVPQIGLAQLAEAFTRALARAEPAPASGIVRRHLSVETVSRQLRRTLARGQFELQGLLDGCRDRFEIIVTFLALLELLRDGSAAVVQAGQFAPIVVEAAGV